MSFVLERLIIQGLKCLCRPTREINHVIACYFTEMARIMANEGKKIHKVKVQMAK